MEVQYKNHVVLFSHHLEYQCSHFDQNVLDVGTKSLVVYAQV
ncbi:unnamed protein product, partial [Schistosoma curassoni]|uniref:Protein kinase domain-containing protein n=1 Tax=Schistosoma curassoni TaxID=6186 RepID=A0A183JIX9_9TREM